jgi:hypothetical protein
MDDQHQVNTANRIPYSSLMYRALALQLIGLIQAAQTHNNQPLLELLFANHCAHMICNS